MKNLLTITMLLTGCALKSSKPRGRICQHSKTTLRCAQYLRNYDGDTVAFNIPNVHPLVGKNISIRVRGIDTPEIKSRNECERQQAKRAKKLVGNILKDAKRIDLENISRGKYFRIVSDIRVNGVLLKDRLIEDKLAYPYYGGRKKIYDWCR